MPQFGYKGLKFDQKNRLVIGSIATEFTANIREELLTKHVLKCFTYGKQVKRDSPPPKK